ncbi:hypothetical protein [Spirosoma sp. KUDC1026]|uniref:hypothetical protein n=1 Tax=Spirosoma sp. KUDC1026 TaxID=2745947 RepID=UPI00159BCA56|nr:hypothetical protein [Spirosoma sp. KUDC1026]QKZ12892.1 hypothetical protein HU175_09710 [Spirosoma sp. KUDC1026]
MKTSYMLLALIVLVTLMGMTATNVLLKQEYDKLDWSNPLQGFDERDLPTVRHWVIDGRRVREIIIEPGAQAKAFIHPKLTEFYQFRQQGDTVFIEAADKLGTTAPYRNWQETASIGLVIRVPTVASIRMSNGLLTVRKFALDSLGVSLVNSRLRTSGLTVTDKCSLNIGRCSKTILGADQYALLQAVVRDSSALQLSNTQISKFAFDPSPRAEIELNGRALQWLKKL